MIRNGQWIAQMRPSGCFPKCKYIEMQQPGNRRKCTHVVRPKIDKRNYRDKRCPVIRLRAWFISTMSIDA
jgi:hypothetical protein